MFLKREHKKRVVRPEIFVVVEKRATTIIVPRL